MLIFIKWMMREIRHEYRFGMLFVFNLALGLTGFLALNSFENSIRQSVQENSKNFLSADLAISSRHIMTPIEMDLARKNLPAEYQESRMLEFFSMATSQKQTRLVSVRAVDFNYPFYGELKLKSGARIISKSQKVITEAPEAWVYPELLPQLNAQIGDEIQVGSLKLKIIDTIEQDSTQTFRLASFAPRIYVGLKNILKSDLIQKGTTISDVYMYRFNEKTNVASIKLELNRKITDTSIQIVDSKEASEDSARTLGYLSDYLGLVSLVGLFLAAFGAGFLLHNFINKKIKSLAIWNALGLARSQGTMLILAVVLLLGAAAAALSLLLSAALLPVLSRTLTEFIPFSFNLGMSSLSILIAFAIGTIGSLVIGGPILLSLGKVKPIYLFSEDLRSQQNFSFKYLLYFIPSGLFFWSIAIWQAQSLKIGSLFILCLLGAMMILALLFQLILRLNLLLKTMQSWTTRHAVKFLVRRVWATLICVISLGIGACLLNLIPQLRSSIKGELETPQNLKLPSLFIFDIQEEQIEGLTAFLQQNDLQFAEPGISPMIRARLIKVNEQNFEKMGAQGAQTREQESEARFRNRGFNLSYRPELSPAERVIEGKFNGTNFDSKIDPLGAISIEQRFAERLGLKINDILTFDVQGVEVKGKISSLRQVKWNSFQPNFFILFQPGLLEEAPKTFLASLPALPSLRLTEVQTALSQHFPNISMIDVGRVIKRIFEISEKMSWSLLLMAVLSLMVGYLVLYSMINYQLKVRRWDFNLLRVLGASSSHIFRIILTEIVFVSLISGLIGFGISLLMTWILAYVLFDGALKFDLTLGAATVLGMSLLSVILSLRETYRLSHENLSTILKSDGI